MYNTEDLRSKPYSKHIVYLETCQNFVVLFDQKEDFFVIARFGTLFLFEAFKICTSSSNRGWKNLKTKKKSLQNGM